MSKAERIDALESVVLATEVVALTVEAELVLTYNDEG